MIDNQTIFQTLVEIENSLRFLAANGCRGFAPPGHVLEKLEKWGKGREAFTETLESIQADLGDCQRCNLARGRNRIVFGDGSPNARLMFIGEGPGAEEDRQGKPFVGAAGQLLTRIIAAMKRSRDQVYICNIIKCRPPGNRNPESDEIKTCFPFLARQIAAIQPDFIIALGTIAAQTLLGTATSISRLRGRFHEYQGIKVVPTYHPAYLLRNPDKKRDVWEDMKMLMKEYQYED
jgi:DNA polymerase